MIFHVTGNFAAVFCKAREGSTDPRTGEAYTQLRLGELLGVSDSLISKWENGQSEPTDPLIVNRLAELLEQPAAIFLKARGFNVDLPPLTDDEQSLLQTFHRLRGEDEKAAFLVSVQGVVQGLRLLRRPQG